MRRPLIVIAVATAVLGATSALTREAPSLQADGTPSFEMVAPPPTMCNDAVPSVITATASVVFETFDLNAPLDTLSWYVDDVAAGPSGTIYVLNISARRITVISPGGNRQVWDLADELQNPAALALGPEGMVYVLDGPQVKVFTPEGTIDGVVAIPFPARSIAVDAEGNIAASRWLYTGGDPTGDYAVLVPAERTPKILGTAADGAIGHRPLIAPVHNRVSVSTGPPGVFATWYHYDPTVNVYRDGHLVTSISGCLDPAVHDTYRRQLQARDVRYQRAIRQVSGVFVDSGGDVYYMVPDRFKDAGRLARYNSRGEVVEVLEFPYPAGHALGGAVLFLGSPYDFLTWEPRVPRPRVERWSLARR